MTDQDYLVTSARSESCVWCHHDIPAGTPAELIVSYGDRRWWACEPCAEETRVPAVERTAA